jgi:hypothetical protein
MLLRRLAFCFCLCILGCIEDPQDPVAPGPPPLPIPPETPEAPIRAVEALFNDTVHTAQEKADAYESLFSADVVFGCDPLRAIADAIDCAYPFRPEQARKVFEQVESGSSIAQAHFNIDEAVDLTDQLPGREGWKLVFLPNIHVRIMTGFDGFEFNGMQGEILVEPLDGRGTRWQIAEWMRLPRP